MVSDGDGVGRQRGCSGEFVVMVIVVSSGNPTAAIVAEGLEASSSLVAVQGDSLGLVYPRPLLSVGCLGWSDIFSQSFSRRAWASVLGLRTNEASSSAQMPLASTD
uniref:Uncharacterized protein n=1 Tax=Strombidinopsis acuminata TaxID=141414 RepID=A0A7S3RQI0_9SPIT